MLKQLRIKFVCINMVFLMGMLCAILGIIFQFTRAGLEEESLQMMQAAAARSFGPRMPDGIPEQVRLPYFVVRLEPGGRLRAEGDGYYDLSDEEFLRTLVQAASDAGTSHGVLEEYHLRFLSAATPRQMRCVVFADISSEQAALGHLIRTCVLAGALGFLAFLLVSLLLARWAVRPVEQAWERQKQFVADASHELKTPLTVITTNAELLQNPDYSSQDRQRFAQNILTMSHQMRGLVGGLLELARVDSGTARLVFEPVDLSGLVAEALLPFEALFFEKGLVLNERIEPGVWVSGSPSHLRQVADILLDNAQKYASVPGEVTAAVKKRGRGRCLLSVSSSGEAIAPEDLKHIFQRFYRLDKARSMDHSYGLGLPIAQGIVTAHRGKIWAESAGGQNTFYVELPALEQSV